MQHNLPCTGMLLAIVAALGHLGTCYEVAKQQQPIPRVIDIPQFYPELSAQFRYAQHIDGFLDYFDTPGLACTVISPDNNAISNTMKYMGGSIGLFLQNKTMQEQVFNYHVIPNRRLMAEELAAEGVTPALTKTNETVWFVQRGKQLYAAFARNYLVPLKLADIKVNGCVVHSVDSMLLIPPSLIPTFEQWLTDSGTPPVSVPESQWAPPLPAAPGAPQAPALVQAEAAAAPPTQQSAAIPAPLGAPSAASAAGTARVGRSRALAAACAVALIAAGLA